MLKWIRSASDAISPSKTPETRSCEVVQVDEMWHIVNGKKTKYGYGEQFAGYRAQLLDGTSVIVLKEV